MTNKTAQMLGMATVSVMLLSGCESWQSASGVKSSQASQKPAVQVASQPSTPVKKSGTMVNSLFYVYADKGARVNHFAPSGWMGDYGDLKINDGDTNDPVDGRTCIKVSYSALGTQGANWAGIYWQQPANNWGDKAGGYDLSNMKRLTFWARGAKGGEKIAEFKMGGITGDNGDSDSASVGPITLTQDWKKYTIDLADKNLSHVVGGFCWSASRDDNPNGFTMYLDEIRYER